eukprot:snap_masked-scaffold_3-processed-gene-21.68-mRNA-1 protein AED:1.00 eAED:1.00 QI:0/0/0/0/1/1/2/0/67
MRTQKKPNIFRLIALTLQPKKQYFPPSILVKLDSARALRPRGSLSSFVLNRAVKGFEVDLICIKQKK